MSKNKMIIFNWSRKGKKEERRRRRLRRKKHEHMNIWTRPFSFSLPWRCNNLPDVDVLSRSKDGTQVLNMCSPERELLDFCLCSFSFSFFPLGMIFSFMLLLLLLLLTDSWKYTTALSDMHLMWKKTNETIHSESLAGRWTGPGSCSHLLGALHEGTDPVDVIQLVELSTQTVESQPQLLFLWRVRLWRTNIILITTFTWHSQLEELLPYDWTTHMHVNMFTPTETPR